MAQIPSPFVPSGAPVGNAGGDLSGTYPNPTVAKSSTNPFAVVAETISGASASGLLGITNTTTTTTPDINLTENAAASLAHGVKVSGDTNNRFTIDATGKMMWGPGNAGMDLDLYRSSAGHLTTDESFGAINIVAGAGGGLGDNGSGKLQLANAGTVPTTNPTGGGVIYAVNGTPFVRDSNGAVNTLVGGGVASGGATGVLAETCHAYTASATATPNSGTLYIQRIFLAAGQKISNIGFVTGSTAATGPTHWWTALLDNGYKQQAHAADQLTAAIAATTWQTLAMATPYTATYSGAYFLAVMIATSSVQPTLVCTTTVPNAPLINGTNVLTPVPGGTSTTALTAPGTDNTTVYATPTAASNFYYLYAS